MKAVIAQVFARGSEKLLTCHQKSHDYTNRLSLWVINVSCDLNTKTSAPGGNTQHQDHKTARTSPGKPSVWVWLQEISTKLNIKSRIRKCKEYDTAVTQRRASTKTHRPGKEDRSNYTHHASTTVLHKGAGRGREVCVVTR